jgi:hypothetical protein
MDNLFLSREIGSIETGPQTFTRTDVLDTTFYFTKFILSPDEPGLLNSVLIQNAGRNTLNGTFTYTTEFQGKPYYNKDGNANLFIVYFNGGWGIYDFSLTSEPIYFGAQDVLYPWAVTSWSVLNPVYNPAPNVTKVL